MKEELLKILASNGIQMDEGVFVRQHVKTPEGIGKLVGVDLIHPQSGKPYPEPMNVMIHNKSVMYPINEVFGATFKDYTIDNPDGFGRTKWFWFWVIQGFCLALLLAGIITFTGGGWVAILLALLVEGAVLWGTWMNFKLKWV